MADQDLRIVVRAETGAAQNALGKLADEMAGLTKATGKEGSEQQRLARQTAETTAKVQAAREAVERAKRAQSEAAAVTQAFGKDSREAAEALDRLKHAEDTATKSARDAEVALEGAAQAVSEAAKSADQKALPALKRMSDTLQQAGKDADKAATDLRTLEARIESTARASGGLKGALGDAFSSFKGNLAANAVMALGEGLAATAMHALSTTANFERLKTALETTTGSTEEANKKFAELQAFAAATPFSLNEVSEAFIKLSNRGVHASNGVLRSLGNTASAMGKTLDDAVEAAADAITGENERLKEFGIVGKLAGDKVEYTFRGVTKSVERNKDAIMAYLREIGDTQFAGGMEAQAKTLGGMWSTMKDGFDQFIVSVMDSGITDTLKSMMATLSGMDDTGRVLGDTLGFFLGGAFRVVGVAAKVFLETLEALFWGLDKLLIPLRMVKEAAGGVASAFADETTKAMAEFAKQQAVIDEQIASRRAEEDARYWESAKGSGKMAEDMFRLIDLSGEYALALTQEGFHQLNVADAINKRTRAEDDLWAKLEKRNAKAEEQALEDAFFAANEMGPALPPGFEREKKKGGKKKKATEFLDPTDVSIIRGFDGVAASEALAGDASSRRDDDSFAAEEQARTKRIAAMEAEVEMMNITTDMRRESVDGVFVEIEVANAAADRHEEIIRRRLDAEIDLARWQAKNAKTYATQEQARTRLEAAEHKKRLVDLQRSVDTEAKEHKRKAKVVETVTSAVTVLGDGMIAAFERMAEGEKGVMAQMIADLLKGVAKKHAILALGEVAQGVAATAMTWGIPNPKAAAHFAAAGLHTAVAVAAGVGAFAAGKVADAQQGNGGGGSGGRGAGASSPFGTANSGSGSTSEGRDGLEAQEVPISHEQLRRADSSVRRGSAAPGASVNIGKIEVYGAGGKQEFIDDIRRGIARSDRSGSRARV